MLSLPRTSEAWEGHAQITRFALQAYESWEDTTFEPIEKVLPALKVGGHGPAANRAAFADLLGIQKDKVGWDWQPMTPSPAADAASSAPAASAPVPAIEVLVYSTVEPDGGMDQNLNLGPDQKYMGGYEGLSSQGIRHMYYQPWNPLAPISTFHYPLHEMGMAPERAALFFDLARQAHDAGHAFWAYRFLGWGLHYVEDMGQPYHATQFASFKLLAVSTLMTVGWEAFIAETQRLVGNFHLAFERYADYLMQSETDSGIVMAFKVPKGDDDLKQLLEQKGGDFPVRSMVQRLAQSSAELAPKVVDAEFALLGSLLTDPKMALSIGFYDEAGKAKIDIPGIDKANVSGESRRKLFDQTEAALSNTGVAVRWYVDQFKAMSHEPK